MRIEILKSTIVDLQTVSKGDFVETSDRTATLLIGMGKAKEAPLLQNVVITPDVEKTPVKKKPTPKRKTKANGDSQSGV